MQIETTASGVMETVVVVGAFIVFGLGASPGFRQDPATGSPYSSEMTEDAPDETRDAPSRPTIWLLDGFNVLHAGPLGGQDRSEWWKSERRDELLEIVARFDDREAEVWVVFDGPRPIPGETADAPLNPRKIFAPSADDWLLKRVRDADEPGAIAVVTGDRRVAARAKHRGAQVFAPRDFLARCPEDDVTTSG